MSSVDNYKKGIFEELLNIIDLQLVSGNNDSLTVKDLSDNKEKSIKVGEDYLTDDKKRYCSVNVDDSGFSLKTGNDKNVSDRFSKNGMQYYEVSSKFSDSDDIVQLTLSDDNNIYHISIFNKNDKKCALFRIRAYNGNIFDIDYNESDTERNITIYSCVGGFINSVSLSFNEEVSDKHFAQITVKEFVQEVYKKDIPVDEIDDYFNAICSKIGPHIEDISNAIKTLDENLFNILVEHFDFYQTLINKTDSKSLPVIDILFEQHFQTKLAHYMEEKRKTA